LTLFKGAKKQVCLCLQRVSLDVSIRDSDGRCVACYGLLRSAISPALNGNNTFERVIEPVGSGERDEMAGTLFVSELAPVFEKEAVGPLCSGPRSLMKLTDDL